METIDRLMKIDGHQNLIRDTKSMAVLNTDGEALKQYKARKDKKEQEKQELEQMKKDINSIKDVLGKIFEKLETL